MKIIQSYFASRLSSLIYFDHLAKHAAHNVMTILFVLQYVLFMCCSFGSDIFSQNKLYTAI